MKNLSKLTALALSGVLALSSGRLRRQRNRVHTRARETSGTGDAGPRDRVSRWRDRLYRRHLQLAPHVALDAATEGFMDAINEALPVR